MTHINWNPSPSEMRRWAVTIALALSVVGSLFYFVDWGIFSGGQGFARFLWSFGAVALLTGITGTKLGLPAYWAWMGFVKVVSSLIGYTCLFVVFYLVVTPMAVMARMIGRDRLQLNARGRGSYWINLDPRKGHNPERQF